MENAVDAMYIAGAVLLLLVALTVGISSFSTQINQIDEIVQADERVDIATDSSGNYINYISEDSENGNRVVGVETIVNTLYRLYKENYTVYIKFNNTSISNDLKEKYNIEIKNEYSVFKITTEYNLQNAKEKLNIIMDEYLYNNLANAKFIEKIGVLYQDDIGEGYMTEDQKRVSDINKIKSRIITYEQTT